MYFWFLPSMLSSGTSTIRTRASGRRTTGTTTTGATPGTHRGAQALSSQCTPEAPTGFFHQHLPRPLICPHRVLWCWGTGHPRAASLQPTASLLRASSTTGLGIFLWIQTGNNELLFSFSPSLLPLPLSVLLSLTTYTPLPWSCSDAIMTEGGPLSVHSSQPCSRPSASQTLMQLVVNSSGTVLTVYFSGFKKKKK